MKKNITIAIVDRLAREARILAAKKDTSVSGLLADFLESIVINSRPFNNGINLIAISNGFFKTFEDNDSYPIGADCSACIVVKRTAMSIGR